MPDLAPLLNGRIAHWYTDIPTPRPALPGDREADVCIVGAGYTGLWTAYHLIRQDPSLRVTVLEARFAGFGASGRNGGWLSGLPPGDRARLTRRHGAAAVTAWQRALDDTIDEVIEIAADEGIDAGIVKGGSLSVARTAAQAARLAAVVAADRRWGVAVDDLGPGEVAERIRIDGVLAGAFVAQSAAIQPAALVRGLADTVERRGVTLFESTPATAVHPGRVETATGTVRAPVVLLATEGFTAALPGRRRRWLPMNSSMIATAPLPSELWADVGWEGRETLGDTAHGFLYAQRTADGRIAIGGRGKPYRFGSRTDVDGRVPGQTVAQLTSALHRLLPQVRDVPIERAWCGVLGVPRDWQAGVRFDPATGLGDAGGYTGHGVTAAALAGHTLADLVARRDTDRTRLPWVGHRSRGWEPEPLRWLGVNGMYLAYRMADRIESDGRRETARVATLADRISGRP